MGESPIRYIRVKKARRVKIRGAIINSYSSRTERNDFCGCVWKQKSLARSSLERESTAIVLSKMVAYLSGLLVIDNGGRLSDSPVTGAAPRNVSLPEVLSILQRACGMSSSIRRHTETLKLRKVKGASKKRYPDPEIG